MDASVSWAALGALAGLPLVWLKQWSWSPAATQSLPALEDMHRTRLQMVAPWLQRMSRAHVAAVMACEVLPMTLLLLPAAQSVIAAWSSVAASLPPLGPAVQETAAGGGEPRETLVRLVGLLLTATLAAICQGTELSPSEEEFEVSAASLPLPLPLLPHCCCLATLLRLVQSVLPATASLYAHLQHRLPPSFVPVQVIQAAVDNSDRYYRLTTMSVGSRQEDAEHAALAFRCVSQVYLETRGDAALLAGAFTFLEVLFLGGLWYLAGMNVAAPAAAAMAIASVDYYHLHQAVEGSGGQGQ